MLSADKAASKSRAPHTEAIPYKEKRSSTKQRNITTTSTHSRIMKRIVIRLLLCCCSLGPAAVAELSAAAHLPLGRGRQSAALPAHPYGDIVTTDYHYDRQMAVHYSRYPQNDVAYTYGTTGNGIGRIAEIEDGSGVQEISYDEMGSISRNVRTFAVPFDDRQYVFAMNFDYDSRNRRNKETSASPSSGGLEETAISSI